MQTIKITTNKNVKVISVGEEQAEPQVIRNNRHNADTQTIALKQQYVEAKKRYKAEIKAKKQPGKISRKYSVLRSNRPIAVVLGIDSSQQNVYIEPHRAYGCYLNMKYVFRKKDSLNPYTYKCWAYPRDNFISVTENAISVSRFEPLKKGTVSFSVSAGGSLFNLKNDTGRRSSAGVLGLELSVDFSYAGNRWLSFNAGAATDVLPLPIDYFGIGYIERSSVVYTSIRDNFSKGRFDFGYGLNLSRLFYSATPHGDSLLPVLKTRTTGHGASISANYQIRQFMKVGVLYQPNIVNLNSAAPRGYQHYMAIRLTLSFGKKKRRDGS